MKCNVAVFHACCESFVVGSVCLQQLKKKSVFKLKVTHNGSGFGGLEVACWPLVPKFTGSNPAEAVGFFRPKKSSARLPSEGK